MNFLNRLNGTKSFVYKEWILFRFLKEVSFVEELEQ